jgi:DNA topoisomerase-1
VNAPGAAELRRHGLRYSTDEDPGIRRRRHGAGFGYRHDDGTRVDAGQRARIDALVIPPAWTDVWICPDERGHVQATGRDARGRKQHRYHAEWRRMRDERKFGSLAGFGDALPDLRARIEDDLSRPGFDADKMAALVLALMDSTLIRVGNDEYARSNGTFGLTTLTRRHVVMAPGEVRFRFVGKGGVRHEVDVDDRRLARLVRRCHELGGRELFSFRDDDGEIRRVDSADANEYLRAVVGDDHSVKTFRTWGASSFAVSELAPDGVVEDPHRLLEVTDLVARRLGNTRAVARSSYLHPGIESWAADGSLAAAWRSSRTTPTMQRGERALRTLLAS